MSRVTWSDVFAALPDTGFFEVVRHYLGPVSTPFHKPDLVGRMKEFFARDEVTRRVLDYIDPDDALFLTFIGFHKQPTEENLIRMIPGIRYVALRETLLNLEERLLIWSRTDGKIRHYVLTPLGEIVKESGLLGPGAVVGDGEIVDKNYGRSWFDDNFLIAVLAFLNEGVPLFRKEGGWRKKTLEILADRFPILFRDGRGEERLILAGRALLAAGMAIRKDDLLVPRLDVWREMESRSIDERSAIMKARATAGRSLPAEIAIKAIRLVTECLPAGRAYTQDKLASLFQLGTGGASPLSPQGARRIVAHLELMGELFADNKGLLSRSNRNTTGSPEFEGPSLSMTAVGDIALRPGMPLFCDLALAAEPVKVDVVTTFRMDKNRFISGLDAGVDPEVFFSDLESYSGHPVPSNVRTLALEWETDYRTITMKLGVVFQAGGIRRQIIEETGILDSYAYSRPAEGIWLLDPAEESQWREALSSIGIDRLPPLLSPSGTPAVPAIEDQDSTPPYLPWSREFQDPALCGYTWTKTREHDVTEILATLNKAADSASLTSEEQEAFRERLERRIILVPEQIRKGSWRFEVMSAKGLDYRGKLRLVEAAISGRDERLAVTLAVGTSVETVLVLPMKLEKDGEDHVLVGLTLPEEEEVRYKIRKIGFLKRIKASLF